MRTADTIHFCPPARVVIGCGARAQLPALVAHLGWRRGLLVTDAFFAQSTRWVDEYVAAAAALGVRTQVWAGGLPDPTTTLCDEADAQVRAAAGGELPDHVIALGGGSNIDLAKALCATLASGLPVRELVGRSLVRLRPLPLVAMPTTAGTGSEATPGAILVDPDSATKVAVMDNALRPQIALIDPELTYTCPPKVTADAGLDALTHAIESFVTCDSFDFERAGAPDPGYSGRSSLTMLHARESIGLCARFLERAWRDGSDLEARIGMAHASLHAALSYGSAGLNAVHGIAYAVAGATHASHGSTNAVMLPYVLDALREARRDELLEIARLWGIGPRADARATIDALVRELRALVARLGIAPDLRGFGIAEDALDALVRDALAVTRLARAFPAADVQGTYGRIVRNAWRGALPAA